jgi:hypothetical protein
MEVCLSDLDGLGANLVALRLQHAIDDFRSELGQAAPELDEADVPTNQSAAKA